MVTLDDVKSYLRLDIDDDDNLLMSLIPVATAHIRAVVDGFDANYQVSDGRDYCKIADLCIIATVAEIYTKRIGDSSQSQNYSFIIQNMIEILQFYVGDDIKNGID